MGPRLKMVGTLVLGALLLAPLTVEAGGEGLGMPLSPDFTGISGETEPVLLNPAAAIGLPPGTQIGFFTSFGGASAPGAGTTLRASLLERFGLTGGGFILWRKEDGSGRETELSYTVAVGRGDAALGARVAHLWLEPAGGPAVSGWTADAGWTHRISARAWLGLSAERLLASGQVRLRRPLGIRSGLTVADPVREGSFVTVGIGDPDAADPRGRLAELGLLVPVNERLDALLSYEYALDSGASRWAAGATARLNGIHLQAGYESGGTYQFGIGWFF